MGVFREFDKDPRVVFNPYSDLDRFRMEALVRVPGALEGKGILPISATTVDGRKLVMVVDLDKLAKGVSLDAIISEGEILETKT